MDMEPLGVQEPCLKEKIKAPACHLLSQWHGASDIGYREVSEAVLGSFARIGPVFESSRSVWTCGFSGFGFNCWLFASILTN